MRIAIVHDWLNGMRGGEKVLEALLEMLPQPTIFTLFHQAGKVSRLIESLPRDDLPVADIAAAFQESVADVLSAKAVVAANEHGVRQMALAGGVAANSALRQLIQERSPVPVLLPPIRYCTDNAAMIAAAGYYRYSLGHVSELDIDVQPTWPLS